MSLHFRLRPPRVGSESKNKEPDKSGSCRLIMGLDSTCTCPACVVLGSRRSWNEGGPVRPDGSGEVIRTESALAPSIGTARYQQGNIYVFKYRSPPYSKSSSSPGLPLSVRVSVITGVPLSSSSDSAASSSRPL